MQILVNGRAEAKKQKKRYCSTGQLKLLPYKSKCILCSNPVSLYLNNSSLARKTYSCLDNKSADDLKKRLLETAEKQVRIDPGGTRAIQVKGRLISMNDLVAEMKHVHNSNAKSSSSIVCQPIIDSNPNDYSTSNTDLLRCIQLEKPNYAVITFDLPIWLKAVDLILSQRMPIIPSLRGFHLLKSYSATFGVIFADSGLHDIINLIYEGELAADSILNGNSYDKAI